MHIYFFIRKVRILNDARIRFDYVSKGGNIKSNAALQVCLCNDLQYSSDAP